MTPCMVPRTKRILLLRTGSECSRLMICLVRTLSTFYTGCLEQYDGRRSEKLCLGLIHYLYYVPARGGYSYLYISTIHICFVAMFEIGVNVIESLSLSDHVLSRWTQGLCCRSFLVQAGRVTNLVVGRCHQLGQEEDLNHNHAWNAEKRSSSSLPNDTSSPNETLKPFVT